MNGQGSSPQALVPILSLSSLVWLGSLPKRLNVSLALVKERAAAKTADPPGLLQASSSYLGSRETRVCL